jgi:hypothetical protein
MTTTLDPALNVPCPTCRVRAGQPCRSRRAISIHQGRRQALADLSAQAGQLLSASPQPESRKMELRKNGSTAPPKPVLAGKTGGPVPDDDENWPPWEKGPAPAVGLAWCPVHQRHEELPFSGCQMRG